MFKRPFSETIPLVVRSEVDPSIDTSLSSGVNKTSGEFVPSTPIILTEEGRSVFDHLYLDPTFFLGVPSSYSIEASAPVLHNIRESVVTTQCRNVKFFPSGLNHLQKVEIAVLPNGITYKLQSIWYRTSVTTKNVSTQTEEDIHRPGMPIDSVLFGCS